MADKKAGAVEPQPFLMPISVNLWLDTDELNSLVGVLWTTEPIRRYIVGSNHSFHRRFRRELRHFRRELAVKLRKVRQKRKAYKRRKPACRLIFLAQREGFEPSWDCSQTDFESAPLWPLRYRCVYFSQHQPSKNASEKGENWWRELQKFFLLMIPPKPWKIKVFQESRSKVVTRFRVRLVMTTSIRLHSIIIQF